MLKEMSVKEIAAKLGIKVGTVMVINANAMRKLRKNKEFREAFEEIYRKEPKCSKE